MESCCPYGPTSQHTLLLVGICDAGLAHPGCMLSRCIIIYCNPQRQSRQQIQAVDFNHGDRCDIGNGAPLT